MRLFRNRLFITSILLLLVVISIGLYLRLRDNDPFQGAAVVDPPFTPLTYGIHAFLWWDGGEVGMNLDWVRTMRFTHVKQTVGWRELQPERGDDFNFARMDALMLSLIHI